MKKASLKDILTYSISGLLFVSLILIVIGACGTVFETYRFYSSFNSDGKSLISVYQGIDYYFGEGLKQIDAALKNEYYREDFYNATKAFCIILSIAYYILIASILVFGTLQVINIVKFINKKKELNTRWSKYLLFSALFYLFILFNIGLGKNSSLTTNYYEEIGARMAWGSILIVISASLSLLTLIMEMVINYIYLEKKESLFSLGIKIASLMMLSAILFLSFGFTFLQRGLGNNTVVESYASGESLLLDFIEKYSSGVGTKINSHFAPALTGYILYIVAIISLLVTFYMVLENKRLISLITLGLSLVLSLVGTIMTLHNYSEYSELGIEQGVTYSISPNVIVGMGLILVLIGLIVIWIYQNKKVVNE